jgi:hypothetical protein
VTAVGYETIQLEDGSLPLLIPMSEVAGRMAVQIGAGLLEKPQGGQGRPAGRCAGSTARRGCNCRRRYCRHQCGACARPECGGRACNESCGGAESGVRMRGWDTHACCRWRTYLRMGGYSFCPTGRRVEMGRSGGCTPQFSPLFSFGKIACQIHQGLIYSFLL